MDALVKDRFAKVFLIALLPFYFELYESEKAKHESSTECQSAIAA